MILISRFRALFRRCGGTMPKTRTPVGDEVRVVLSPGWNGPTMETSANYTGRGLNVWRKPTA